MYEQNASCLVKHSELGAKNFNKIRPKIVKQVLKWPLQHVNFQKFSGGACPRTPLEPFLFSICIKITLPKKTTLGIYVKMWCPLPEKNSEYAADMKTFFKGLIYTFFGSNVFVFG